MLIDWRDIEQVIATCPTRPDSGAIGMCDSAPHRWAGERTQAGGGMVGGPLTKCPESGDRPSYNCRPTYATLCAMSGINPAFIAQQLGRNVQMLLSTYARQLSSSGDQGEM